VSLRARLIAAFAYLLVLTVAALSVPLGLSIERRARAEFESNLVRHAQAIGSSIADSVDDRERRVLNRLVTAYARELGGLVAVAGPSGSILASHGPQALFESASVLRFPTSSSRRSASRPRGHSSSSRPWSAAERWSAR
jgi:hypothetical protein